MAKVAKRRGRYVLDFYDHQGRRQRQALKPGTTMKQARKALRKIEEQVSRGIYIEEGRIPAFKQVAEAWLEHKKPNLRASTWSVYEGHTRVHFPEFLDLKVNRITPALIEKFITTRQAEGMPINTVRKILVTLSQILKYATRHGYLTYNPLTVAERPRPPQEVEQAEAGAIKVFTPAEISAFLGAVKDQKCRTLFMLAIMSGARQGELLGLKWSDVDWDNSQLRIERTFNNGSWYQPKTKGSRRKIDLGPSMMRELRLWRLACPPNGLGLIFPNEAGGPINHSNLVSRYFLPALKAAGIGKVRFHDLRHTFASLLIEQGENIKYIQTQLGHSTPTVTLNVYAHLMKSTNQEAACRLEGKIFGTGHNLVTINEKGATALAVTP
jgi:integrase